MDDNYKYPDEKKIPIEPKKSLFVNDGIAELYFNSLNENEFFNKIKQKEYPNEERNKFKRRLDGYLYRNIILYDTSNLEYKIISNLKIFLGSVLNFCLLFSDVNPLDSSPIYKLIESSLGIDYEASVELFESIENFYQDGFKNLISIRIDYNFKTIEVKNKPIKDFYLFAPNEPRTKYKTPENVKVSKEYLYDALGLLFLGRYLVVLGLDLNKLEAIEPYNEISNKELFIRNKIEHYAFALNRKIADAFLQSKKIDERSESYKGDLHKIYSQIIAVYKNFLEGGVDEVHFFLFNPIDRRLYFTFVETMKIDNESFNNYERACKQWKGYNLSLKLSKSQIDYVKKNIDDNISVNKNQKEILYSIIDNIDNPEWVKKKLFPNETELDKEMEWYILLALSCIPQEPFTGVAGYSASTKVFDISSTGETKIKATEKRWDPSNIDASYFYSKLMIYENIIGVGGEGSMAAFPILDSGQITGVLFITKKPVQDAEIADFKTRSINFPSYILHRSLSLAALLRNFIWLKRINEFSDSVLKDLVSQPREIQNPFKIICGHLYKLFNVLLVVLWEKDSQIPLAPKYIFGYKASPFQKDEGLLPLNYSLFPADSFLYEYLGEKEFNIIQSIKTEESSLLKNHDFELRIIPFDKIEQSLSEGFIRGYIDESKERTQAEEKIKSYSIGEKLFSGSGIIFILKYDNKEYYLTIYFEETQEVLQKNIRYLFNKFEKISEIIKDYNNYLVTIINSHYVSTHSMRSTYTTPLSRRLSKVEEMLQGLEVVDDNSKNLLNNIKQSIRYSKDSLLTDLDYAIATIDNTTVDTNVKREKVNLLEIIKQAWTDKRTDWDLFAKDIEEIYYKNAKLFIYNINSAEPCDILGYDNMNKHENLFEANIHFTREHLRRILITLFNNTFKPSVLPERDYLEKDISKANLHCAIKSYDQHVELEYRNRGKKLSEKQIKWMRETFRAAKEDDLGIVAFNIQDSYREYFSNESTNNKPHGYGLYLVAKFIYLNGRELSDRELITVESDDRQTIFKLIFPKWEVRK